MNNDGIKIHLLIADMEFTMTVHSEREEMLYRKATSQLNNMLNRYRSYFPKEGTERLMAMVAFELSYNALNLEDKNDTQPFKDRLKKLANELDELFGDKGN